MALPASISGLLTAAGPATGGLSSLAGSMFGGDLLGGGGAEADPPVKSEATGTFTAAGLNITKTDPTLIVGLIIGGLLVALALRRGRK